MISSGSQRVKWLGHVGIAQWDEESCQGWKRLGIPLGTLNIILLNQLSLPLEIKNETGQTMDMGASIRDGCSFFLSFITSSSS
jgi:hypothetical protein